ncbi:MAG: hypothetical protein ACYC5H_18725 [Methylovirgula sp.]
MCPSILAAFFGLASACALHGPSKLLAPADPALVSRWSAPRSPTADLKRYAPVEVGNWLDMNRAVTPSQGAKRGMSAMPGMKGMGDSK